MCNHLWNYDNKVQSMQRSQTKTITWFFLKITIHFLLLGGKKYQVFGRNIALPHCWVLIKFYHSSGLVLYSSRMLFLSFFSGWDNHQVFLLKTQVAYYQRVLFFIFILLADSLQTHKQVFLNLLSFTVILTARLLLSVLFVLRQPFFLVFISESTFICWCTSWVNKVCTPFQWACNQRIDLPTLTILGWQFVPNLRHLLQLANTFPLWKKDKLFPHNSSSLLSW